MQRKGNIGNGYTFKETTLSKLCCPPFQKGSVTVLSFYSLSFSPHVLNTSSRSQINVRVLK